MRMEYGWTLLTARQWNLIFKAHGDHSFYWNLYDQPFKRMLLI